MKNKITLPIAILLLTLVFASCEQTDFLPCIKPSGSAVEEIRVTEDFSAVNLYVHAHVLISKGKENSVTVVAAPNIMDHIEVYSNGTTLFIDNTRCLRTRSNEIKVFITTPHIDALGVSGSGYLYLDEGFSGDNLRLALSGSGNIYAEGVFYQKIETALSGSGNINIRGFTPEQSVSISGSGNVNGYLLESDKATVKVSGSGSAKVFVNDFLDARIAGSGNIWYIGNPTVNLNIAGSGAIHHIGQDNSVE